MKNITIKIDRLFDYVIVTDPKSVDEMAKKISDAIQKTVKSIDASDNRSHVIDFAKFLKSIGVELFFSAKGDSISSAISDAQSDKIFQYIGQKAFLGIPVFKLSEITKQDWDNAQ